MTDDAKPKRAKRPKRAKPTKGKGAAKRAKPKRAKPKRAERAARAENADRAERGETPSERKRTGPKPKLEPKADRPDHRAKAPAQRRTPPRVERPARPPSSERFAERAEHGLREVDGPGPRPRHALSNVGGPVEMRGDPEHTGTLAAALASTDADEVDPDTLTHGFHSYPGRMHPAIARHLVAAYSRVDDIVIDPFCGGGTVVLEAMLAGRRAVGVDLNPLAVKLADVRCSRRDTPSRQHFLDALEAVAVRSEERVRARVDSRAPLTREEAAWYEVHILKELAGLREEIVSVEEREDKRALFLVMSAIVVKFSKQLADTSEREVKKRLRKGLVTEFFVRKGQELADRWADLDRALPKDALRPKLFEGDARELEAVLPARVRADLILTSPPYGGTYDYVAHHARRYPWLGMDASRFEQGELGARRRLDTESRAREWDHEVLTVLRSMASVRKSNKTPIILLFGDAQIGKTRLASDQQVHRLAPRAHLELVASASQSRPDQRGGEERREHLLLLY